MKEACLDLLLFRWEEPYFLYLFLKWSHSFLPTVIGWEITPAAFPATDCSWEKCRNKCFSPEHRGRNWVWSKYSFVFWSCGGKDVFIEDLSTSTGQNSVVTKNTSTVHAQGYPLLRPKLVCKMWAWTSLCCLGWPWTYDIYSASFSWLRVYKCIIPIIPNCRAFESSVLTLTTAIEGKSTSDELVWL